MKPTRAQAEAKPDDEVLCDLDAVLSRRVTFIFRGRTHVIEPITVERLFDFWFQVEEFKKLEQKEPDASNAAFYKVMRSVCKTLTLDDCAQMTVVQKGDLVSHVAAKITGNRGALDAVEKKSPVMPMTRPA